jgi:hypothetical protein
MQKCLNEWQAQRNFLGGKTLSSYLIDLLLCVPISVLDPLGVRQLPA